jgi:hypothetical protein
MADAKARLISTTPTIGTGAYADGNHLGAVKEVTNAFDADGDTATLLSVQIVDKAAQAAALDILFFNAEPTLTSTDGTALNISDAEMTSKFMGRVSVAATDYTTVTSCSEATVLGLGLLLQAAAGTNKLYYLLRSRGAPTYGATDALVVKLGLLQD